jgi:hypothetical protein
MKEIFKISQIYLVLKGLGLYRHIITINSSTLLAYNVFKVFLEAVREKQGWFLFYSLNKKYVS